MDKSSGFSLINILKTSNGGIISLVKFIDINDETAINKLLKFSKLKFLPSCFKILIFCCILSKDENSLLLSLHICCIFLDKGKLELNLQK